MFPTAMEALSLIAKARNRKILPEPHDLAAAIASLADAPGDLLAGNFLHFTSEPPSKPAHRARWLAKKVFQGNLGQEMQVSGIWRGCQS